MNQLANPVVAKTPHISVDKLRELLAYDATTGALTWLRSANHSVVGCVAGAIEKQGYVVVKVMGRTYKASRIAWAIHYGEWPSIRVSIDHRDLNKQNNRISNLRPADLSSNRRNNAGNRDTASGMKGAYPHGRGWRSMIWVDGRLKRLGMFPTPELANDAYRRAAQVHYGEFARASAEHLIPDCDGVTDCYFAAAGDLERKTALESER